MAFGPGTSASFPSGASCSASARSRRRPYVCSGLVLLGGDAGRDGASPDGRGPATVVAMHRPADDPRRFFEAVADSPVSARRSGRAERDPLQPTRTPSARWPSTTAWRRSRRSPASEFERRSPSLRFRRRHRALRDPPSRREAVARSRCRTASTRGCCAHAGRAGDPGPPGECRCGCAAACSPGPPEDWRGSRAGAVDRRSASWRIGWAAALRSRRAARTARPG